MIMVGTASERLENGARLYAHGKVEQTPVCQSAYGETINQ